MQVCVQRFAPICLSFSEGSTALCPPKISHCGFHNGNCEGRRGRGRPRRRWTQDIGEWMGVSTVEAGRQALERGEFRQAVWEATSIKDPHRRRRTLIFLIFVWLCSDFFLSIHKTAYSLDLNKHNNKGVP